MLETELKKIVPLLTAFNENLEALLKLASLTSEPEAPEPEAPEPEAPEPEATPEPEAPKAKRPKRKPEPEPDDLDLDDDEDDVPDDVTGADVKKLAHEMIEKKLMTRAKIKSLIVDTGHQMIGQMDQAARNTVYFSMLNVFKRK